MSPREWRLQKEWVNFTRQSETCFAGERYLLIHDNGNPALLFITNQIPQSSIGCNDRESRYRISETADVQE